MRALRSGEFRSIPGEHYGTPKELFSFRLRAQAGAPMAIAKDFLLANAKLYGLQPGLQGVHFNKKIESVAAQHVIFQQRHFDLRVQRAYVTVHLDHDGRVFLSKNRSVPAELLPAKADFRLSEAKAIAAARSALPDGGKRRTTIIQATEEMWYPERARLTPAWRVRLARRRPAEEWIVYLDARTGRIINLYDNVAAAVRGRAQVFDPNPVIALGSHESLLTARENRTRRPPAAAYRTVTLLGLVGNGRLEGQHVTTRATAGKHRVRSTDHTYLLQSHACGFDEVMCYYHIDSAIRWLEQLGYKGRRKLFKQPIEVDVNGTRDSNAWYSPAERRITFGTGSIDAAEDGETIVHELGHAIQDAICPDFGQSEEAAAMGEGFGDYFAASFFEERKPEKYRTTVMSWFGLFPGLEAGLEPPGDRRVDEKLTFANFSKRRDEHDNGRIWSAALWAIRKQLGRVLADTLLIESHFQLDAFTTFARGARAIIDADANLNRGANGTFLRRVFKRRKIGPV